MAACKMLSALKAPGTDSMSSWFASMVVLVIFEIRSSVDLEI